MHTTMCLNFIKSHLCGVVCRIATKPSIDYLCRKCCVTRKIVQFYSITRAHDTQTEYVTVYVQI